MKRIHSIFALCALVLLFGTKLNAQSIDFHHGSVAEVLQQAKSTGKLVFVDCLTDWCGPCKYMSANTFTDPAVGKMFNEQFVNYKLDMEKGEGVAFAKKYSVRAYPTLLFLDGDGNLVHAAVGAVDPENFISLGKDAQNPEKQLGPAITKFQNGERSLYFLTDYILKMSEAGMDVNEAVLAWKEKVKPAEMLSNDSYWMVFNYNFKKIDSDFFRYVVDNKAKFEAAYTAEAVQNKLMNCYSYAISHAMQSGDDAKVPAIKKEFSTVCGKEADGQITYIEMLSAQQLGDMDVFKAKAELMAEKYAHDNWSMLNGIAWSYFELVDEKKDLEKAVKWAKRSVELNETFYNLDTYGNLLAKVGDKKAAITTLEKAIAIAKESGESYDETQEALDELKN